MWAWNKYGEDHMHGWVYQQGDWSWGCVLTWHIAWLGMQIWELGPEEKWSCYLWKWDADIGWQYRKIRYGDSNKASRVITAPMHPRDVHFAPWMEHSYF